MARGRPPMDCEEINNKTFQRKKEDTIKKQQHKKCASRESHSSKPCKIMNDKCVTKTNSDKHITKGVFDEKCDVTKGKKILTKDPKFKEFEKKCNSLKTAKGEPCKVIYDITGKAASCKVLKQIKTSIGCNEAKMKPLSLFKNKAEQKNDLKQRCKKLGESINKKCVVSKQNKCKQQV